MLISTWIIWLFGIGLVITFFLAKGNMHDANIMQERLNRFNNNIIKALELKIAELEEKNRFLAEEILDENKLIAWEHIADSRLKDIVAESKENVAYF